MPEYAVPEQYAGKTLSDIRNITNAAFRPDILAGFLGINEKTPLQSGQFLQANLPGHYAGSGEQQFLQQYFQPGEQVRQQQSQQLATTQAEEARRLGQEAVQPAIKTLQAQQEPLKERYNKIIEDIQAQKGLRTKQTEIASAREYGKRGVPLSSGAYDQYLQEQRLPVDVQFGSLLQQAGGEQESKLLQLAQAIAGLQAQGGLGGFTAGQQAGQFAQTQGQQASQYAQTLAETIRQSGVSEQLERLKLEQAQQEDPFARYQEVAPGSTILDLITGKPMFTAPKTYKGGGDGNDPYKIRK